MADLLPPDHSPCNSHSNALHKVSNYMEDGSPQVDALLTHFMAVFMADGIFTIVMARRMLANFNILSTYQTHCILMQQSSVLLLQAACIKIFFSAVPCRCVCLPEAPCTLEIPQ